MRLLPQPVHLGRSAEGLWSFAEERLRDLAMRNLPILQIARHQRSCGTDFHDCSTQVRNVPRRHLSRNGGANTVLVRYETWKVECVKTGLTKISFFSGWVDIWKKCLSFVDVAQIWNQSSHLQTCSVQTSRKFHRDFGQKQRSKVHVSFRRNQAGLQVKILVKVKLNPDFKNVCAYRPVDRRTEVKQSAQIDHRPYGADSYNHKVWKKD